MSNWQPIELAPTYQPDQQSKEVLLYSKEFGVKMGVAVRYPGGHVETHAHGFHGDWNITHWMPLPEIPAEGIPS